MSIKKMLFFMTIAVWVTVFSSVSAYAGTDVKTLFAEGNAYYETGDYEKAVEAYEKILKEGYESGNVYYNLGDAYFKKGDLGRAVLNYERAELIIPRDSDLAANLRFVEEKIKGNRKDPVVSIWNWMPLRTYERSLTANELSLSASALYVLMVIMLFGAVAMPGNRRKFLVISVILLLLSLVTTAVLSHKVSGNKAVIVGSETEALFSPFDSGTKFFTLYEGMVCSVLENKDDWYKVRREDGKVGWIKKEALEII
ncbi:MAG: tetratricopeptide repeat protein [Candidatus Omnitrophota bacterium]